MYDISSVDLFNALSLGCVVTSSYHDQVLVMSLIPMIVLVCIWLVWALRVAFLPAHRSRQRDDLYASHVAAAIIVSYLVMPGNSNQTRTHAHNLRYALTFIDWPSDSTRTGKKAAARRR